MGTVMDDPVVKELDVFLSQELRDSLYLLQYPLRPANKPFNTSDGSYGGYEAAGPSLAKARIKPRHLKLEVSFPLDTRSDRYDEDIGSQMAEDADKEIPMKDDERPPKMFPAGKMDYHVLRSSAVPQNTHYTIAVLSDGEVHLSPLHALLQMRPSFGHLDEADRKKKASETGYDAPTDAEEAEDSGPLKVKFKRRETERAVAARERSHTYLKQQEIEEPWIDLEYIPGDSEDSRSRRRKLYSANPQTKMAFPQTPSQYLQTIDAKRELHDNNRSAASDIPLRDLKMLTLHEQIRKLLVRAHVLRLDHLSRFVSTADKRQMLDGLQRDAHLLSGCWVVKSKLVYPPNPSDSKVKQIPSMTALRRGRDFLLLQFYRKERVTRAQLLQHTKLPAEHLEQMLKKVAVSTPGAGWTFKLEPDHDFIRDHPAVVEDQEGRWQEFMRSLEGDLIPRTQSSADVHRTMEGIVESGGKFDKIIKGAVLACLQENVIASIEQLLKAVQATDELVQDISADELYLSIQKMDLAYDATTTFDGIEKRRFVCKDELRPDIDKYRQAIVPVFVSTAQVQRKDIVEAVKRASLPEMPGSLYNKMLKEIATSEGNHWVLKSSD